MLKRMQAAKRRGFTLAEVLIAFALIAVLASVTVPAVRSRIQDGYEDAIIQELQTLATGVVAYRQDVGKYPPNTTYLATLPFPTFPATANIAKDLCGNTLTSNDSARWSGPYISRPLASTVTSYNIATRDAVQTLINRNGSTLVYVSINGIDTATAHNVDQRVDGLVDPLTGIIRYSNSGNTVVLQWMIPIRAGSC